MRFTEQETVIIYLSAIIFTVGMAYIFYPIIRKRLDNIKIFYLKWNMTRIRIYYENFFFAIIPIMYILLATFRNSSVGTDTNSYYYSYNIARDTYKSTEPLYYVLEVIATTLFKEFSGVLFLTSLVSCFFVSKAIFGYFEKRYTVCFAFFIFGTAYYLYSYNIARQFIAMSIMFFAYRYIIEKNIKKYLVYCIIAVAFHSSALVCIPFYFVSLLDSRKRQIIFYGIMVLLTVITAPALSVISQFVIIKGGLYTFSSEFRVGFLVEYVIPLIIIILYEFRMLKIENSRWDIIKNVFLLSIPLRTLGYGHVTLMRIALYSEIIQVVLIPMGIDGIKNKVMKNCTIVLVVIYYLFYFYNTYIIGNMGETVPYILNV